MSETRSGEGHRLTLYRPGGDALTNADVADRLHEIASLLENQDANPYRVHAYRRAAEMIRALPRPVRLSWCCRAGEPGRSTDAGG